MVRKQVFFINPSLRNTGCVDLLRELRGRRLWDKAGRLSIAELIDGVLVNTVLDGRSRILGLRFVGSILQAYCFGTLASVVVSFGLRKPGVG
jgi:hypothetical protein